MRTTLLKNSATGRALLAATLLGLLTLMAGCACGGGGDEGGDKTDKSDKSDKPDKSDKGSKKDEDKGLKVKSIHATNETSFAVMSDGTVRAWGSNAYGQLGWGEINQDTATPVAVKGLKNVEKLYVGGSNYNATACALLKDDSVKCWGDSDLIPGVSKDSTEPAEVEALKGMKFLSLGGGHACMVTGKGEVECWGSGAFGVLGQGDKDERKEPTKVKGLKDIAQVRCGLNHTCALGESGEVWCWGNNFDGQSDPANAGFNKDVMEPRKVEGAKDGVKLGVNEDTSCIIDKKDRLWCWGENFREKEPVEALKGKKVVALSRGFSGHGCAIDDKGEAHCWGRNTFGQAGVKPAKDTRELRGDAREVKGLKDVIDIATGYTSNHTCAATADGKAYCWGRNRYGAIGNATVVDAWKPQEVKEVTAAKLPKPVNGFDTAESKGEATTWPDELPKGCKAPNKVRIKLAKEDSLKKFEVLHTSATVKERKSNDGKVGDRIEVDLRSYAYDPTLSVFEHDQHPRGTQFAVTFSFTRDKATEEKDGDKKKTVKSALNNEPGDYTLGFASGEDRREVGVRGYLRRETVFFGQGFGKSYKGVELTHVSDKWICGEFDLKSDDNTLKGRFAARVRK